jgi:hypothetical protein
MSSAEMVPIPRAAAIALIRACFGISAAAAFSMNSRADIGFDAADSQVLCLSAAHFCVWQPDLLHLRRRGKLFGAGTGEKARVVGLTLLGVTHV